MADEKLEENERMLLELNGKRETIEPLNNTTGRKNRKESLREFLKTVGSLGSLASHGENVHSSRTGILHQCLATFAVLVLTAGAGQPIGFSAVLLPQLYVENSTMQIDMELGSWITSIHSAASPVGSLIAGPVMDHWGRRRTLELSVPPLFCGWLCLALSPHIAVLMLGRFLCGYGVGNIAAVSQVYLGEISDPWLRGLLLGTPFVSYSIGILIMYSLGRLPWRWVASSGLILPAVAGLLLFNMPESPVWLVRHNKLTKAHSALKWLHGDEPLAKKEIHQIVSARAREREEQAESQETFWTLITKPAIYKPLLLINIFNLLQVLSGTYVVIFYAVDIISDATGSDLDSIQTATYSAIVRLIFAIIGCYLLLHLSRRSLSMISGIGSTAASLTLSIYLMCKSEKEKTETDFWVTVICILIYIASNTLGFMMLPSLMSGELLPAKIRGMCGGYIFMIFNILLFLAAKLYPLIMLHFGSQGLFMIFGVSSLIGTVFLFLFLPETKDKSLIQIEQYFQGANFLWITNKN